MARNRGPSDGGVIMTGAWITAKYPGQCRGCPERIEVGFTVYYMPRNRATLCHKCGVRQQGTTLAASELARQRAAFAIQTAYHKED